MPFKAQVSDVDALCMTLPAGMARMRHTLQALQARAQAAMALADNGPASLVQTLSGLLPPLANSGMCRYLLLCYHQSCRQTYAVVTAVSSG